MKRASAPRDGVKRDKAPDIREVARRAGVSISTVSRFLNQKPVRPDAEARIYTAIRELAYSPNRIARSLKLKRTNTIGMIIPDITNPIFPEVVKGVEVAAREAGFSLVLSNMGEDRDVGSPIPTRPISSDEFMPLEASPRQREFAARVRAYGDGFAAHQGLSRRRYFQTAAGRPLPSSR